jgi:hypothetical protein
VIRRFAQRHRGLVAGAAFGLTALALENLAKLHETRGDTAEAARVRERMVALRSVK